MGREHGALFEVVGAFVYPAAGHPTGPSPRPWFQLRDGFAYAVDAHPEGVCAEPSFLVLGCDVYPVEVEAAPGSARRCRGSGEHRGFLTGEYRRPIDQHRAEARADDLRGDAAERGPRLRPSAPVGAHHQQGGADLLRDVVDGIRRTVRAQDV